MEQDVHSVVAVRLQATEVEVKVAVGEYGEGAVRFVALDSSHRSAPKVVLENLPERRFGAVEVIVGQNGSMVIEHKVSIQGA